MCAQSTPALCLDVFRELSPGQRPIWLKLLFWRPRRSFGETTGAAVCQSIAFAGDVLATLVQNSRCTFVPIDSR